MTLNTRVFSRKLHKRFVITWWAMGSLLLPIAFFLHSFSPLLSDNYFYDAWLSWREKPPSSDILIVAIDESSLQALGRWPWPRNIHAQLIQKLQDDNVENIVLDILLVEPSRLPSEDVLLAESMREHGAVYLPVSLLTDYQAGNSMRDVLIPTLPLLQAAKATGHINIDIDKNGVPRTVELIKSRDGQQWPQLMVPVSADRAIKLPSQPVRIPFRGPSGHYPTVSYVDVLMGSVPASLLNGRTVIIGITAQGLGDLYNVSLLSKGLMPGVEIHAHLLDAIRDGALIREVRQEFGALMASMPIIILMLLAWWLRFRHLLLTTMLLSIGVLAFSLTMLSFRWWWPPTASLIALGMASIVIVGQSQAILLSWFKQELDLLYQEPAMLPYKEKKLILNSGSRIYQQSQALELALNRLVDGRRFIFDALHSLPLPIFILNKEGGVMLANKKALALRGEKNFCSIKHINDLLQALTFEKNQTLTSLWPPAFTAGMIEKNICNGGVCVDGKGSTYRLEMGSLATSVRSIEESWLLWLVDLTSEVEAEAQRASMLRFLSHDMKAPQTRALALIDAQREPELALSQEVFYRTLEQDLNTGVGMINDFIDLTRVETLNFENSFVLLEDIVIEVLDQVFPLAQAKSIKIISTCNDEGGAPVMGDKGYLSRAIFNLIENAVKYSYPRGEILVHVVVNNKWVYLNVIDEGVGVNNKDINAIFEDYRRSGEYNMAQGHGLGLALVKAVAENHGGCVSCKSELGVGSHFIFKIPRLEE
ncbi:MAG: CHASE2 domain-containing protein [Halomonas sp.]|nr:CHASE2 and HATPase_c domain-containing protein [Halomonas sp.]MBP5978699.1 CHASE2 domain-containing protein [Halomonas sp.]